MTEEELLRQQELLFEQSRLKYQAQQQSWVEFRGNNNKVSPYDNALVLVYCFFLLRFTILFHEIY